MLEVGIEPTERNCLSLIFEQLHELIVFKYSIVGLIMLYPYSYFLYVGLKGPLRLYCLSKGESILYLYIIKITVLIHKYCFCTVALLLRSSLQLGN